MDDENQKGTAGAENQKDESAGTKTFDDFLKEGENQAEFDRRMTKGIQTALKKKEEELKKQWELEQNEKLSEAEKLAGMSEKQKQEYQLKQIEKERDAYSAELNAYKLKDQTKKIAEEKGLPLALIDLLDFRNIKAEEVGTRIDTMLDTFNKAVEKAVNDKLKEATPQSKQGGDTNSKRHVSRASY